MKWSRWWWWWRLGVEAKRMPACFCIALRMTSARPVDKGSLTSASDVASHVKPYRIQAETVQISASECAFSTTILPFA